MKSEWWCGSLAARYPAPDKAVTHWPGITLISGGEASQRALRSPVNASTGTENAEGVGREGRCRDAGADVSVSGGDVGGTVLVSAWLVM